MRNNTKIVYPDRYDSSDPIYRKNYNKLLKQDLKKVEKMYYKNIVGGKGYEKYVDLCRYIRNGKPLDYNTRENSAEVEKNLETFLNMYKTIRTRNMEPYDNKKADEYEKFLCLYNKIETTIDHNNRVYVHGIKDEPSIPMHRFYFGNYDYRSVYYDYILEQDEESRDNNEYALFIHHNLHMAVKMLFEFMYEHNIDTTIENIVKIMFFIKNSPFDLIENSAIIDHSTCEDLIIENFTLTELYYQKVEKVYNEMKNNGDEKGMPETAQDMFLEIVDSVNSDLYVYTLHLDDAVDYLTNDTYNGSVYNIPLNIAIQSIFQYVDREEAFNNEEIQGRVRNAPDTKSGFLPFGSCFMRSRDSRVDIDYYNLGYEYLMKKMEIPLVSYKEKLHVSLGNENRSYDPFNGHKEYVFCK